MNESHTSTPADLSPTGELCRELIRRPSVTPADHGCQELLATRLKAKGFSIEPMRFGEVDNLWARWGTEGPLLVLAGHTDVVPTGDLKKWKHAPFEGEVVGDMIFGRGAADMKGSIASMITAAERYLERHSPEASIAFLITSDEEGPALDGTKRVINTLQDRGETIDWCIVGEPSSTNTLGDTIRNGRRGSLSGALLVNGIQGHVAYPQLADNPIHKALASLTELVAVTWDSGNDYFPPTTLQISNIHAGTGVGNVIPADLSVNFNLRFSTELTPEAIKEQVQNLFDRHLLDYTLNWTLSGMPFLTKAGKLTDVAQEVIARHLQIEAKLDTGGGTSDGRFIAPTGAQVIELGPMNTTIHQTDECISLPDLDRMSLIVEDIIDGMLS